MNTIRFDYKDYGDGESSIYDNVKDEYYFDCNLDKIADELNELHEENKELKSILQEMGLIMSDEEVKDIRDEIALKLIKPLFKGNGFDVDVNTENGFTVTPKGVNND